MTQRKILLTGASGVVGSALLRHFNRQPVPLPLVLLAHRKPVSMPSLVGDITRPWLGLSPADYRTLAAEVDVVIHCAASVNFRAPPKLLHDINVRGTGQVLQFVADARARLVHVSTAFIASVGDAQEPAAADSEEAPVLKDYARSKRKGELMVRESGLPTTIARVSTVIGDSATGEIERLQSFQYLLGAAMRGMLPFIPYVAGTRADLIPQDTVAAALAALARPDSALGDYWLTAGPAALPLPRVLDLGFEVAVDNLRLDVSAPKLYYEAFRPRLVEPATYSRVMEMVFAQAKAEARPSSILPQLPGLLASYSPVVAFPTSLGQIAGGPPAPTEQELEHAVRSTCRYLHSLPKELWDFI